MSLQFEINKSVRSDNHWQSRNFEVIVQLTSFTDYGLRALIYLASLPEGKMTSITEVTEVYGVSRNHMVKIINQLSHLGYVKATRGKNGGSP